MRAHNAQRRVIERRALNPISCSKSKTNTVKPYGDDTCTFKLNGLSQNLLGILVKEFLVAFVRYPLNSFLKSPGF